MRSVPPWEIRGGKMKGVIASIVAAFLAYHLLKTPRPGPEQWSDEEFVWPPEGLSYEDRRVADDLVLKVCDSKLVYQPLVLLSHAC